MKLDFFFSQPRLYVEKLLRAGFKDVTSPTDGVTYPNICTEIPDEMRAEVMHVLRHLVKDDIKMKFLFARQSPVGVKAPHQAHTDAEMGKYTLLVYLNEKYEDGVGTEIVHHKATGMRVHPSNEEELAIWKRDTNVFDAWERDYFCQAVFNRGLVIDSQLYHRALPVNGCGEGDKSRLVLIGFFD